MKWVTKNKGKCKTPTNFSHMQHFLHFSKENHISNNKYWICIKQIILEDNLVCENVVQKNGL